MHMCALKQAVLWHNVKKSIDLTPCKRWTLQSWFLRSGQFAERLCRFYILKFASAKALVTPSLHQNVHVGTLSPTRWNISIEIKGSNINLYWTKKYQKSSVVSYTISLNTSRNSVQACTPNISWHQSAFNMDTWLYQDTASILLPNITKWLPMQRMRVPPINSLSFTRIVLECTHMCPIKGKSELQGTFASKVLLRNLRLKSLQKIYNGVPHVQCCYLPAISQAASMDCSRPGIMMDWLMHCIDGQFITRGWNWRYLSSRDDSQHSTQTTSPNSCWISPWSYLRAVK